MKKRRWITLLAGLALLGGALAAHPTDNDRRTAAQCQELQEQNHRRACLACVARPNPHHYHANGPAGERCRPNNGQR
ncbi:MAG: hypothetical protein H7A21_08195 [Spirochaetales bacterium]|nr:hypothetical protein [Leptospiraceae bacterium]MCP5481395.1 hypothetical protein [Spirochaetales bacterium]